MRKSNYLLFIFFIFLICFPICKASFLVFPRELSITMDNEFISGNTSKRVLISNNIDEILNVSWYLDNPTLDLIRENRTFIPFLSWINIEPEWQVIQPNGNAYFYIYLDIPNNPQNMNQHWEVWPTFKEDNTQTFNLEHTVRLYIDTPAEIKNDDRLNIFSIENLVIILIIIIAVVIILFFIRKKNYKK
jgi:hypothetical protein